MVTQSRGKGGVGFVAGGELQMEAGSFHHEARISDL